MESIRTKTKMKNIKNMSRTVRLKRCKSDLMDKIDNDIFDSGNGFNIMVDKNGCIFSAHEIVNKVIEYNLGCYIKKDGTLRVI